MNHPEMAYGAPERRSGWRFVLAAAGLAALAGLVYGAGAGEVFNQIAALGWTAPLILVPYGIGVFLDARGLGVTLPTRGAGARIPLGRLTRLRLAGEAINGLTPTAYLGGEPVKAHLLYREGVGATDAVAAVVVAKTALITAQIMFVVTGLVLFLFHREDTAHPVATAGLLVGLALVVVLAMVEVQRRGLVARVAGWGLRRFPRSSMLARLHTHAHRIDENLDRLYGRDRGAFLASTAYQLMAWVVGAGEVMIVLGLLQHPVGFGAALIIESLSGTVRVLSFLIPGTIGVQELGGVFVCGLMGVPAVPALSLMLLKRGREMLFTSIGLVALARYHRRGARRRPPLGTGELSAGMPGGR